MRRCCCWLHKIAYPDRLIRFTNKIILLNFVRNNPHIFVSKLLWIEKVGVAVTTKKRNISPREKRNEKKGRKQENKCKRRINEFDVHTPLNHYLSLAFLLIWKRTEWFSTCACYSHSSHVLLSGGISHSHFVVWLESNWESSFDIFFVSVISYATIQLYIYIDANLTWIPAANRQTKKIMFKVLFFIRFVST